VGECGLILIQIELLGKFKKGLRVLLKEAQSEEVFWAVELVFA
jgi:hypothetical protein